MKKIITIWEKRILFLNCVVSLLCNRFDDEYIQSLSSVILQLCVWTKHWRNPIVEFAHSFIAGECNLDYCNDLIWCKRFKLCHWYVLIPVGFSFIIAEWVQLVFNRFYKSSVISFEWFRLRSHCAAHHLHFFISSVLLLVKYWRDGSYHDFCMLYITAYSMMKC